MEENKLKVMVSKLEDAFGQLDGLGKLVLKIECSYKNKSLVKYLYQDRNNFLSIHFIYEMIKNCEEFKNLIDKYIFNDLILYKVLVSIEIIGRNSFLDDEDKKNIAKKYNATDQNKLNQLTMNKNLISVERRFYSCSSSNSKIKFKTKFLENFSIFGYFDGDIDISGSVFYKSCSFEGFVESKGDLIANNCDFMGNVDFRIVLENKNLNNSSFKKSIFRKKATFSGVKFLGNANFYNSNFKDCVDFYECEFEKTACFYGSTFEKTPNFSQVIFKESVNLVNTKVNFDYENLNTTIENTSESKDEVANDFRDSFRTFKSALIKDNNLLESSNFHKYELYCKEIELNSKKSKIFSKEWIDKYQLFFYRKLCDHHTDLILNLKWLIITIGMFASMLFMIKLYKCGLSILNIFNFYGLYLSALGSFILSALALFRCIDKMKAFVSINAIAILWVICYKPKLIFGIANLIGDNSYNAFENLLITLYTLIAGLIIFSLQKTARKNTIIPN
ncbi:pentapeptide repeat-containing protein [Campylobacter lari]|nr:pentapeptide repeat-containing protein [Campylobacter lari]